MPEKFGCPAPPPPTGSPYVCTRERGHEGPHRAERRPGEVLGEWRAVVPACVFCQIIMRYAPADIVYEDNRTIAFTPLDPVGEGHLLVVPVVHVKDVREDPQVSGYVMETAAKLAGPSWNVNIITSAGQAATQTVFHLHLHVVPRWWGDGLVLPWGDQFAREEKAAKGVG